MVEIQEVKDYLWITDNSQDVQLQQILDSVNALLVNYIWDYTEWEKTVQIYNNTVKNWLIWFNHIWVTEINSINWVDFENSADQYKLLDDKWQAKVLNLCNYIQNNFGVFDVIYTAWYAENPKDIVRAVSRLVWYYLSQDMWKDIKLEQPWPRKVEYTVNWEWVTEVNVFYQSLNKYIPLHLKNWG